MDTLKIDNIEAEEITDKIIEHLTNNIEKAINRINSLKNDGISIETPNYITLDDPESGFELLDIGQYPAIFVMPIESKNNFPKEAFSFEITGFIRDDNIKTIQRKNLRFAKAVKAVINQDLYLSGYSGGGIIGRVDYAPKFTDGEMFYVAFQIEVAYMN